MIQDRNNHMTKIFSILVACALASVCAGQPTLTIEADKSVAQVSPTLYGLMTEEINHSYDGGLYAELVQNRAFLDSSHSPIHWSVVQDADSSATISLDTNQPLNDKLSTSLRLDVTTASEDHPAGVANTGYWGIPVFPATRYHASFYARAGANFSGPVTVSIVSEDGATVYAHGRVPELTTDWKSYELNLKTSHGITPTAKARLVLTVEKPGTVWFSLVSLFPPTWKDQANGFRKDIMQMLVDMNPKFLRFPGGNYLEGDTIPTRFDWKATVGPISQRHGHRGPWGYRSTDGLGLPEFLKWCEDMGAEPVLAVYAGYSLRGDHVNPGTDLDPFVQDALDEIEYVTGPTTTKWGAQRATDGHPQPYPLHYVEIGNEDWFDRSGSYDARFAQFYNAIKAKYPQLKCISTAGNEQPSEKRVHSVQPDLVDEHYYRNANTFLNDTAHYDNYDRHGPQIFVGEWAAYDTSFPPWDGRSRGLPPTPNMTSALADAAWMTGMERNSDLVKMQCYAPLLVNVNPGARQWRPNLIGYDTLHSFGSPSYYAISMFGQNIGDEILKASLDGSSLAYSVTKDSRDGVIIVKLVNAKATPQTLKLDVKGARLKGTGTAITLAAAPDATNSINDPTSVVPVTSKVKDVEPTLNYTVPANSITVLRLMAR
jgi:alpha-L-arabinofuranosidase